MVSCAFAQTPDPAQRAYDALRGKDYDTAVAAFLAAAQTAPDRASLRKDLAYTYLKIGEPELARDQFREAMRIDAADNTAALEYAFLCYETKRQAEARRVFDRIRKTGNVTAEQAFHNIDDPLAGSIARWRKALELGGDNFSTHFELATLAEQRDELELAAEHYERAWRMLPERRTVLVDLGRVWKAMGRNVDADAALLAASRGGDSRAAEQARELLPEHYPFVDEFRRALTLDPNNHELRRELGYLLLRMNRPTDAEVEFRVITDQNPADLLSATQLGFLLHARGEQTAAMILFARVLAGGEDELANRVRAVLHMPQVLRPRAAASTGSSIDAKIMAERSIKAGYMKDALKYLEVAHESDPGDFDVMLKLGWTNNILHRDRLAFCWFDLARRSPDPKVSADAEKGFRNLRSVNQRYRTSLWLFPIYSSRWRDLFTYGQAKTEVRFDGLPVRPYLSMRFVGDSRRAAGTVSPQYLS
jgi:tetratricopeptide (TPR) repeat protein